MANFLNATRNTADDLNEVFNRNWYWLLGLGLILVCLGVLSIVTSSLTALVSIISLGIFLIINGGLLVYQAFRIWRFQTGRFYSQIIVSILYMLAGCYFVINPIKGVISVTLLLAFFYILLGLYRSFIAIRDQIPARGWAAFSGAVTTLLGIFILTKWPEISLFALGTLVGIDIALLGLSFIMSALTVKRNEVF